MSTIQNQCRVTLKYTVTDLEGSVLDNTEEPVQYTHGQKQIFPALEESLLGREIGERFQITLSAEEAYGEYDPTAQQRLSITSFEDIEDLSIGMTLYTGEGEQQQAVKILDIDAGEVVIDANHPMAGLDLIFDLEVIDIQQ